MKVTTTARVACTSMFALLMMTGTALAQRVYWANPGSLGVGQHSTLDLVFAGTQPHGRVALPPIKGLSILADPGQSSSMSVVNGQRSSMVTLSYPVRPDQQGTVHIPAFDVATSTGEQTVASMTVEVGQPMVPDTARRGTVPLADAVVAEMVPSERKPYAGEVFDVDVIVGSKSRRIVEVVGSPTWTEQHIVSEPWDEGQHASLRGAPGIVFHSRAMVPEPGPIDLAPVQQEVQIETTRTHQAPSGSRRPFDSFFSGGPFDSFDPFSRPKMVNVTVATEPTRLEVQPLPQPAPEGFTGAVGDFTLRSTIVPEDPKAGEPVTWTLTLEGTGNWPVGVELPPRAIPNDIRTIQPKLKRNFSDKELFTGSLSEDLVLVPMKPGEYQLEPVRFVYFDPEKERYETVTVQPPTLQINGTAVVAASGAAAGPAGIAGVGIGSAASAPSRVPPSSANGPLPHGPQRGEASAFAPLSTESLSWLIAVPFVFLAGYWALLAFNRARLTDPRRPRRQALRNLAAAIGRARTAVEGEQRSDALLSWQQAAATFLGLDLAAPTPAHVRDDDDRRAGTDPQWVELWTESDRALYAEDAELPFEWCDRAADLRSRLRRPWFNPLQIFIPRNLFPTAAAAVGLTLMLCSLPVRAGVEPIEEYNAGDFAAAREQFLGQAQADPSDWVARYNLGLVDAQLGANGRALGETTAAFLHEPRNESVRWNLSLLASQVGKIDPRLAQVAFTDGRASIARTASPATWQALLAASAVIFVVGGTLILRRRYLTVTGTRRRWPARLLLASGAVIALVAAISLRQYGPLANPNAAMVAEQAVLHSIPTEAESEQAQRPIAAGTVVVVERDFLGWIKVAVANGETGWVRGTDLVPFYTAPSA